MSVTSLPFCSGDKKDREGLFRVPAKGLSVDALISKSAAGKDAEIIGIVTEILEHNAEVKKHMYVPAILHSNVRTSSTWPCLTVSICRSMRTFAGGVNRLMAAFFTELPLGLPTELRQLLYRLVGELKEDAGNATTLKRIQLVLLNMDPECKTVPAVRLLELNQRPMPRELRLPSPGLVPRVLQAHCGQR